MQSDEISIDDIIKVFRKQWKLMLFPGLFAAVLVALISSTLPPKYESYALLRVGYKGGQPLESIAATREIMKSQPILLEITKRMKGKEDPELAASLEKSFDYENQGELLKVTATGSSLDEAVQYATTVVGIIIERHDVLYQNAQKKLDETVKYVSEKVRPALVASNFGELRMEPTRVEFSATGSGYPIKSKKKLMAAISFFGIFMFSALIAFYREGKEK